MRHVGHVKSHAAQYGGSFGSYPALLNVVAFASEPLGVPAKESTVGSADDSHRVEALMLVLVATAGDKLRNIACRVMCAIIVL